jgi:hypothetical protein
MKPDESINVHKSGNRLVDWAVHNATVTVLARGSMILLFVLAPMLGFFLKSAWDDQRDILKEQRDDLKALNNKLADVNSKMGDMKVIAVTIENMNRRIDKHDNEIEDLRLRFYQMPRVSK